MEKDNEKWEVIVDGEWYFEGTYERAEEVANEFWSDPDFYGNCRLVSESDFFGYE